jgi:hypothetical protein
LLIDVDDKSNLFSSVVSLGRGDVFSVESSIRSAFLSICSELWNEELFNCVSNSHDKALTIDNVIDCMEHKRRMRRDMSNEIEFIASHFDEMSNSLALTDFCLIDAVLSHWSLKIKSEDSLYDFIFSQIQTEPDFFELFAHVQFEFLSVSRVEKFCSMISESIGRMTFSIWTGLSRRIVLSVSPDYSNDRVESHSHRVSKFDPSNSARFEGIIAHLTKRCGGNVHDHNIVTISADHEQPGSPGKYAADLATSTEFCSRNAPNQWICYDFKTMLIEPTHYSIRSYLAAKYVHLKNWIIEGSTDGKSWTELDRRDNNNDLNGSSASATFSISRSAPVRMIRLRQTGPNHGGSNFLDMTAFEIFGSLIE